MYNLTVFQIQNALWNKNCNQIENDVRLQYRYHAAALDDMVSYHHVNCGSNWTHSLGARAFTDKHEC